MKSVLTVDDFFRCICKGYEADVGGDGVRLLKTKCNHESVDALNDVLERRPASDLENFCECLVQTNQKHIVDELLKLIIY
jgi:hypothetical protein